mmetsp:Transcript_26206/g.43738  ORF Transcript_26206/g.43738 Transcript_26206/m.43738 type:complete len:201 (-) Transcript_26206:234-836(-)|eukprot:CAMPEP_0119009398 /NCGR_PEP_ID=MMETSP1176-20130426/4338_1 /TAXON_ID=265551 /ORGANISM="Synedropsis recta cf, Strain CCMP1620" /LENGTH=200 /DNA_ID=CAMNT_0006961907 /DNA_START=122 /DNA_END=724 /DNA_ORIENTATION=-
MSWEKNSNSSNSSNKTHHHSASEQQQQQPRTNNNNNNNNNNASRSRSPQQQRPPPSHQRSSGAQKSVEGWILFVTGIHEDLDEDDLTDLFSDFGVVQQIGIYRNRQTGDKGYALVEYGAYTEAQDAINALHGSSANSKRRSTSGGTASSGTASSSTNHHAPTVIMRVDWAFVKPTGGGHHGHHQSTNRARRGNTGSSTGR